ncbi:MAG: VapE domain-containing protein [Gammaproteobacteria bacterium]
MADTEAAAGWDSAVSQLWPSRLARAESTGAVKPTLANLQIVLNGSDEFRGLMRMNRFSQRIVKTRGTPWESFSNEWTPTDSVLLRAWLSSHHLGEYAKQDIRDGVIAAAEASGFHPVRDYLTSLQWDGKPRIALWLAVYLGASLGRGMKLKDYVDAVGRMFLIGAVKRVMEPGCKFDSVLVLEGGQGIGKSTALSILGGEWHADTPITIGDKDALQAIQGVWLYELAEIEGFTSVEAFKVKALLSSHTDRFRPSYEPQVVEFLRQAVFVGTTNQIADYLRDNTGNRRYWPVMVRKLDREALAEDRDQLWAEAFTRWQEGALCYIGRDDPLWPLFESEQELRATVDPWETAIAQYIDGCPAGYRDQFHTLQLLRDALLMDVNRIDQRASAMRIGKVMRSIGFVKRQATTAEERRISRFFYVRHDTPPPEA